MPSFGEKLTFILFYRIQEEPMNLLDEHQQLASVSGMPGIATMMVLLHVIKLLHENEAITDEEYEGWKTRISEGTAIHVTKRVAAQPTKSAEPARVEQPTDDVPQFQITEVCYRDEWHRLGPGGLANI